MSHDDYFGKRNSDPDIMVLGIPTAPFIAGNVHGTIHTCSGIISNNKIDDFVKWLLEQKEK